MYAAHVKASIKSFPLIPLCHGKLQILRGVGAGVELFLAKAILPPTGGDGNNGSIFSVCIFLYIYAHSYICIKLSVHYTSSYMISL